MELNVQDWKEYKIDNLFTVVLSKGDIKADEMDCGTIRLVSSGETDNGIVAHIDSLGDGKAEIFDRNVITADMFCNAYYQNECFYAVSHGRVNILLPNFELNFYIGLFISTIINNEKHKYSYGRALYSNVVSSMIIKLPTQQDKDNNTYIIDENKTYSDEGYIPDWQFMEDYIKSLHHKPITTKVKVGNVKELDIDNWKEFNVTRLFDICAGNYYSSDDYGYGTTPYVSASATNNGVGQMIDLPPDFSENKIVTGKVECKAFYQGKPFSATSDVNIFTPKFEMTQNVGLFLTSIITFNENGKWSYGRQCRVGDSKGIIIKLPIKHNEENTPVIDENRTYSDEGYIPDWQFMEDYINSLPYSDRI